jgi:type I restriction enzyme R subunit
MLEAARRRIRGLVRLLEKRKRMVVYTDFIDDLGEVEEIALHRGGAAGTDFDRFRQKARAYLRAHAGHVALQKLHRNRPLTQTDLEELDRMLTEARRIHPFTRRTRPPCGDRRALRVCERANAHGRPA